MSGNNFEFSIEELGVGRFVDYETIAYKVDSVVDDNIVLLTALNHDWKPEKAYISELKPIRITEKFLVGNGWEKCEPDKDTNRVTNDEQKYTLKVDNVLFSLYPSTSELFINHHKWIKKISFIHELQNVFVACGMMINSRELSWRPEFFEGNDKD